MTDNSNDYRSLDFVREIITGHNESGRFGGTVHTRFPPEPNGYLHIGHSKSIALNFGIAQEFGGKANLRFDDTNPTKEEQEYIDAIIRDIRWLGFDWEDRLFYASDYFHQLYDWAVALIEKGLAYVDDLTADEIREHRGTLTEPGKDSPYRNRPVAENLDLFRRMKEGEFPDGSKVLRAKIDMAAGNINMRDPVMYRVLHEAHPRTGTEWCIYPMYDWAHGQSDAIEGITHSICTLEFEDHRPLYEWFIDSLGIHKPQQIEFAKLVLTYTMMSKRNLRRLVEEGRVSGWDDPRMPTLSALRRRGIPPKALRDLADRVGVAKTNSVVEIDLLDYFIRQNLNQSAPRRMVVLNPLKVVITNYPEGQVDMLEAINNPEDESAGTRMVPFSKEFYIEQDDFMEEPYRKFYRLAPGREVRLRYAYFVTCTDVIKDENGEIVELHCTYDPATKGGDAPDGRKVKGTLHWVSAAHAVDAEIRNYDRLFSAETPGSTTGNWMDDLNPASLEILTNAKLEPALVDAEMGVTVQFERQGYYTPDSVDSSPDHLVFNRTIALRDGWAKIQKQMNG
ncbi:MAG: glutamine--tRNA ligase/YqeY domain fusion protein [Caldilineaceae bacterium]|nr:glutamine--tRNA ligase/YqeY domain fusion protein [Caldilineaceae bacterium]MBP8107183.1 glutamine--tRNA ligase/YqeY domain fusion protein [Caldilineaceae bacterium]MBP8122218.1 glutamine--tRNA ligase/YqeY domain fusion protein [Caldilineaceae bacterium]MBP9072789.1 glutamine--tRNA ligase/YqeY domain fusion protein [Caldilineaceae bacterium]